MKKALAALTVGATLLLGACSLPESGATPSPASTPAADITTSRPVTAPGIEFEILDASPDRPLGVDYGTLPVDKEALSEESRLKNVDPIDIFTEKQIAEGAEFALESYHQLRTDPRLFSPDRSPDTDDKVVTDNAHTLGRYLLDGWELDRNHGLNLSYVDADAELRVDGEDFMVDPSGRHTIAYLDPTIVGGYTQGDEKPALSITFIEDRIHTVEDGSEVRVVNWVDLMVQTDSESGWKMEGMFWEEAEPIGLVGSEGTKEQTL